MLTPTYVQQTVRIIDDMYINVAAAKMSFAEKKMGGKALPAGIQLLVQYTNRTGGAKKFAYNIEVFIRSVLGGNRIFDEELSGKSYSVSHHEEGVIKSHWLGL